MNEFFGSVIWLIVALGVLISFHEFGHFWVARRLGVKVLRFSVGFGRPLWQRRGKDGTEYVIAALPLGGYVRMLDEREDEVAPEEAHLAFNRKPVLSRIAIVAAGPIFNLILAVAVFWVMFMIGITDMRPVIGETSKMTAAAGITPQAEIVRVGERQIETWSDAFQALLLPAMERQNTIVEIDHPIHGRSRHELPFSQLPDDFSETQLLESIGIQPWRIPVAAILGEVRDGLPAAQAGLQPGDRLSRINGQAINDWYDVISVLNEQGEAGRALTVTWQRDGQTLSSDIIPTLDDSNGRPRPVLGISPNQPSADTLQQWQDYQTVVRYGPLDALGVAFRHTARLTSDTLSMLKQLVLGRASLDNLSGPITIARLANDSAGMGVARFLSFLGIVSLSLGILNLLPIPLLDGGHLLYYLIELAKGSPVPERIQIAGQYVGIFMLAGLMGLAIFNDILRLLA